MSGEVRLGFWCSGGGAPECSGGGPHGNVGSGGGEPLGGGRPEGTPGGAHSEGKWGGGDPDGMGGRPPVVFGGRERLPLGNCLFSICGVINEAHS
jgi:hypothetical protein